ncbi:Putative HORMA domain-containing protein [Septoria linicola]|uniref:HORMA domain-containing protein n=1 Tax=Septoria linicola TaxID=215465 RepID=A0A9Q9EN83_9PEZI|nr:Putative HORMA domain-containing protein [Septoria linicola]
MASEPATFIAFVTAFTDFLTVAVHTILYERGIYPQTSFISARKYNFAVRQSRHPKVCEWINDAVTAVEVELLKGSAERVAVVIYSKQNKPMERVVFDVSHFPIVPAAEHSTPLEAIEGSNDPVLPFIDLEEQLRATMSRLSTCGANMKPLPAGCTFTVAVELRPEGQAPLEHPQQWIPAQDTTTVKGADLDKRTRPIRAVRAGNMVFETWIEELEDKTVSDTSQSSFG